MAWISAKAQQAGFRLLFAVMLAGAANLACGVEATGEVALPDPTGTSGPTPKPTDDPTVNDPPLAVPGAGYMALLGEFVTLDASESIDPDGTITAYEWTFDDGQVIPGMIIERSFSLYGTSVATLTVTDDGGEKGTATVEVLVNSPPTGDAGGFREAITNQLLTFDAAGSTDLDGTITSYAWQFSDGQTSSARSMQRSFASVGNYTVTLTVTDDLGATSQDQATISVGLPPNMLPTASFTAPSSGTTGVQISANGAASSDPDGTIVSYSWNFGDGGTSSGSSVTHTYTSASTFTIRLTVQDDRGATASMDRNITISLPANQSPTASFTLSPSSAQAGQSVTANGSGSFDPDGSISSYAWDFGDGSTSSGSSRNHTWTSPGTYTVRLTVTDNRGGTGSTSRNITISAAPATGDIPCDNAQTYNFTTQFGTVSSISRTAEPTHSSPCTDNDRVLNMVAGGSFNTGGFVTGSYAGSNTRTLESQFKITAGDSSFAGFWLCPSYGTPSNERVCAHAKRTTFSLYVEDSGCTFSNDYGVAYSALQPNTWYRFSVTLSRVSSTSISLNMTLRQGGTQIRQSTATISNCPSAFLSGSNQRAGVAALGTASGLTVEVDDVKFDAQ